MAVYQFSLLRPVAITDTGTFARNHTSAYYSSTGIRTASAVNTPRFGYDPTTLLPLGLIMEAAATNVLLQSNDFTQAAWVKTQVTATTAAGTGADGTTSLNLLTAAAATSNHYSAQNVTVAANVVRSFSLDVKSFGSGNCTHAQVFYDDGAGANGAFVIVRLADGVITKVATAIGTGSAAAAKVVSLPNGIYRVTITGQHSGTTARVGACMVQTADAAVGTLGPSWTAATTDKMYVSAAQLEDGTTDTSYIPTTTVAVTRPADVNTQMMTSSVAEPATVNNADPIIWTSGMTITAGTQVYRAVTNGIHKIYQRLTAGPASSTPPESDTTNWVYVKPTNRWAMFDAVNETQTQNANDIVVVLQPGQLVDSLMFDNLEGDSIRVQVLNSSYDMTIQLKYKACSNWFQYFFEPYSFKKTAVFTGLPLLTTNVIMITIRKAASVAKAGTCVLGLSRPLGYAEPGATVGIIDYSSKTVDQFGSTTVVQRSYSKRMNVSVIIQNADLDAVQELLANYRAQPVAWIGAGNLYSALSVYGYYRSFDIVIAYPTQSRCNLEIEGLI